MVQKSVNYSEPIIFAQNICEYQNICKYLSPIPLGGAFNGLKFFKPQLYRLGRANSTRAKEH